MRVCILFLILLFSSSVYAQLTSLDVSGEFNVTSGLWGLFPISASSEVINGITFWSVTSASKQTVATNSAFLFSNNSYAHKWAGPNLTVNIVSKNTINSYTYTTGSPTAQGGDNHISDGITSGKYYTFRFKDNGNASTEAIVMETDHTPVTITYSSQSPIAASVTSNNSVTVNFNISATASPQEKFYVRYSIDNWTTSSFSTANITSGLSYSATIPAQTAGKTVKYYILSTTFTGSPTHAEADLIRLRQDNNNGGLINWSYSVSLSMDVSGQFSSGATQFATVENILSSNYWTLSTIATQTVSTNSTFIFSDFTQGNKWGNVSANKNTVNTFTYGTSGISDNQISDGITSGHHYTFRFKQSNTNSGLADGTAIVMETTNSPVTLNSVSQSPIASLVTNNNSVAVTFQVSATPSAQEKFYIRYSTDNWTTSSFVLATAGTYPNYSGTIPAQLTGTVVKYYVLSTTLTGLPTHDIADLIRLNQNNNSSANYQYTVFHATYNTPQLTAGVPTSVGWYSTEKIETLHSCDFYFTWDATYLYFAFYGGTDYSNNDRYNIAIDVDPTGTNGSSAVFGGVNCLESTQKPDYMVQVYLTDNSGAATLFKNNGGSWTLPGTTINSIVGGTNEYRLGNDVKIRVPISVLTGATGVANYSASNPVQILMFLTNKNDFPFAVMPSNSNAQGGGNTVVSAYNYLKYSSLTAGMNPSTDYSYSLLPVELSSFTYNVTGKTINLKWKTAIEINNYGFEIEKKTSANFVKIGFVQGHGNSNAPFNFSFSDENTLGLSKITYRLKQIDNDGKFAYSDEINVDITPKAFSLSQNYPNPFNPATVVNFSLPAESMVRLKVYNVLGEVVKEVINSVKSAGVHQVSIDAANLSTGIYFYSLTAHSIDGKTNFTQTKKMLLNK